MKTLQCTQHQHVCNQALWEIHKNFWPSQLILCSLLTVFVFHEKEDVKLQQMCSNQNQEPTYIKYPMYCTTLLVGHMNSIQMNIFFHSGTANWESVSGATPNVRPVKLRFRLSEMGCLNEATAAPFYILSWGLSNWYQMISTPSYDHLVS